MDFETDNPEKGQLLKKSAQHRTILEEEVKLISERTEKIITSALVVGGALALTYFLVSRLSEPREKPKKARKIKLVESTDENESAVETTHEPQEAGIVSQIGAALMAQATTYLLSIAKEKLSEFLEAQAVKKGQNNNEHPH
jgi:hypothetical protein